MPITKIAVHQVDLPLHEGSYNWSGGKSVQVFDSTIVLIETDAGLTGCGEVFPLGPACLPAYAAGARAGIEELAPQLTGLDPTQLGALNRHMDRALKGHPYVKTAIDIACGDIFGQAAGVPVAEALGAATATTSCSTAPSSQQSAAQSIDASEPQVGNAMWELSVTDPDGYRLHFERPNDVPEDTSLKLVTAV